MADKRTGRARQGTHPKVALEDVTVLPGGKTLYQTKSGQAARGVITKAATDNERVAIKVKLKNGDVREVWKNPGHGRGASASWVRGKLGKTAATMKGAIAAQAEVFDSDEVQAGPIRSSDIQEFQITVYS